MANSNSWEKIFADHKILDHDFSKNPFTITAKMIKKSCQDFETTSEKEVRILCKQDNRESVPKIMQENKLFLLPVKNGTYVIIKGEGYFNIPEIKNETIYDSSLNFKLDTSFVGDSEMQHLDYAYASSIIRTFMKDESLLLTIRGRKYTSKFNFFVKHQLIKVEKVQIEVDAGYEGKNKVVLVEAKNSKTNNSNIRQLFYPFKHWSLHTKKKIHLLFFVFERKKNKYSIWEYHFKDPNNYNSIELIKSKKIKIEK